MNSKLLIANDIMKIVANIYKSKDETLAPYAEVLEKLSNTLVKDAEVDMKRMTEQGTIELVPSEVKHELAEIPDNKPDKFIDSINIPDTIAAIKGKM